VTFRKYRPQYRKDSNELEVPERSDEPAWVTLSATIVVVIALLIMGVTLGFTISHFITGGK